MTEISKIEFYIDSYVFVTTLSFSQFTPHVKLSTHTMFHRNLIEFNTIVFRLDSGFR